MDYYWLLHMHSNTHIDSLAFLPISSVISQSAGTRVHLPLWAILLAAIGVLVLLSQVITVK